MGLNAREAWLGGQRDATDQNSWVWSDGTTWGFTKWASWAPNGQPGTQDCVRISQRDSDGGWDNWDCSDEGSFVCKKGDEKTILQ